jgi:hypothetical protein
LRIRMADGNSFIEWTLLGTDKSGVFARQVDKSGTYRLPFATTDLAGAWIIEQANFARNEMGFKFTNLV